MSFIFATGGFAEGFTFHISHRYEGGVSTAMKFTLFGTVRLLTERALGLPRGVSLIHAEFGMRAANYSRIRLCAKDACALDVQ